MFCAGVFYNGIMTSGKSTNDKYAPSYVAPEKYRPKAPNPNKKVEKVWGFSVLSFMGLMAIFVVKYLIDFWIFPNAFKDLYPMSVGAIILWFVSSLLFIFLALKFITRMGFFYPAAFILYGVLVWALPNGMFGLEGTMQSLALALVMYVLMRIIQRAMLWIFILIGFVKM